MKHAEPRGLLHLDSFRRDVAELGLLRTRTLLLSVSGGLDSMALWHLVHALALPHEVAHVNFGLRGEDSDADERLVQEVAHERDTRIHVHAPTPAPGGAHARGVQTRARRQRRAFTEALSRSMGAAPILLAHHANDQAETVLMQLARGTGGVGLAGMRPAHGPYFRPLLAYARAAIAAYARDHEVRYREDASNATNRYTRNHVRHEALPALEAAEPRAIAGILQTAAHHRDLTTFAEFATATLLRTARLPAHEAATVGDGFAGVYDRDALARTAGLATLLYCWLTPAGYRSAQIIALASWLTDGRPQRRRMLHPGGREAVTIAGRRVYRERLPHHP